jgi:hypothetical protein
MSDPYHLDSQTQGVPKNEQADEYTIGLLHSPPSLVSHFPCHIAACEFFRNRIFPLDFLQRAGLHRRLIRGHPTKQNYFPHASSFREMHHFPPPRRASPVSAITLTHHCVPGQGEVRMTSNTQALPGLLHVVCVPSSAYSTIYDSGFFALSEISPPHPRSFSCPVFVFLLILCHFIHDTQHFLLHTSHNYMHCSLRPLPALTFFKSMSHVY